MPQFAIADTSSAAASLLNGLNAAANQQATQQRLQQNTQAAQDRQDQQDYFKAIQDGWVPAQTETRMANGMIDRSQASSPNQDPSRQATIGRRLMYKPTDQETGKAFVPTGHLGDALKTAGWDGKTPVTPEQSHGIMQALNEAQPSDEAYDIDTSGKFQDAQGNPAAVMVGKKTGTVRMLNMGGTQTSGQSSPGAAPGGPFDTSAQESGPRMFDQTGQNLPQSQQSAPPQSSGGVRFAPAQKAEKPDASQIVPGQVGPNGGPLIYDKNSQSMKEIPPVPGSRQVMTAAQTEADKDRHVTQARLAEDTAARLSAGDQKKAENAAKAQSVVQQKHDDFRSQEKDQWNLKGFYDKLIDPSQTPDNATVTLPSYNARTGEINEGQTRVMNPDLRGSLTRLSKQAADKAMENQESARKIRKSMGWGEFAKPAQTASSAPAQQPAQRGAAQPAPTAQTAPPGVTEGTIIVNKQTKQRQMWKGGKWAPAPSLP